VGVVCIVFLLVGGTAQAAHFCETAAISYRGAAQLHPASARTSLCLVCLMAQSATATPIFLTLSPILLNTSSVPIARVRSRSFLNSFHLYVRPPPAR
jgi:hypothetical protein